MAQQSPVGRDLLIVENSWSHSDTPTLGGTPLDEWSARRRNLYLTTHNTNNRLTSMLPVEFEVTISAGERPQTHVSDGAATGTGKVKGKGKVHPRTGHEEPEGESRYNSTSLTSALDGMGGHRHAPAAVPPEKTWYPLYRRQGGTQSRSGRVWEISPPPGFDPRTVQPVASGLNRLSYRGP
jgi:hypothetical protein